MRSQIHQPFGVLFVGKIVFLDIMIIKLILITLIPFYYSNKYQNPLMQRFLVFTVTYTLTSSIIVFMEVAA